MGEGERQLFSIICWHASGKLSIGNQILIKTRTEMGERKAPSRHDTNWVTLSFFRSPSLPLFSFFLTSFTQLNPIVQCHRANTHLHADRHRIPSPLSPLFNSLVCKFTTDGTSIFFSLSPNSFLIQSIVEKVPSQSLLVVAHRAEINQCLPARERKKKK